MSILIVSTVLDACSLDEVEQIVQIAQDRRWQMKGEPKPTKLQQLTQSLDSCTSDELTGLIAKAKERHADLEKDTIKPGEALAKVVSAQIGDYWVKHIDAILAKTTSSIGQPPQLKWEVHSVPELEVRRAIVKHYESRGYKATSFTDTRIEISLELDVDAMSDAMDKSSK